MSEKNSIEKEEIEEKSNYDETLERNKWVSLVLLVVGAFFMSIGFLVMVLSYALEYLIDTNEYTLIAFIIGAAMCVGGLFLCAKVSILNLPTERQSAAYLEHYFDSKEKPKKSVGFFSFSTRRLWAAGFLLGMGFLDLFILTGAISHHQSPYGQAIVLGGPSYYYTVAWFPHMFGFGLLLYVFISTCRQTYSSTEKNINIHEFRPYAPWITEIPKDDIEAIRYQNTQLGPKFVWLVLLLPFIILSFLEGLYFIQVERLDDPTQPIIFMISSVLEICALYFLMLKPQKYFEIATKDDLYEMFFDPYSKDDNNSLNITNDIASVLECSTGEMKATEFMKANNINPTHRDYLKLIIGICLISASIPMWHFFILFGNFYWWFATIWGAILIVKAISEDFSDRNGVSVDFNESEKKLKFRRKFRSKFYNLGTFQPTDVKLTRQFRKLDAFDVLAIPGMLMFITIQLTQGWLFADERVIWILMAYSTAFMVLVCVGVFLYLCVPIDQIEFKTPTIKYFIPVSVEGSKHLHLNAAFSGDLKGTFIIRCLAIAITIIASVTGTLINLALNFI